MTITAGRTGTAWLAEFLGENLSIRSVHEPLQIDDFGVRMPDIRIMRSFNERGNNELCKEFYQRKFGEIANMSAYCETNHTLSKCGMVENLAEHSILKDTQLFILTRNLYSQCLSYLQRCDFLNIANVWQWYLNFGYPNVIVNPKPFSHFHEMGQAVWYAHEMLARQLYYKRVYGDFVPMMQIALEDITQQQAANQLLRWLGKDQPAKLPLPMNTQKMPENSELAQKLSHRLQAFSYNIEDALAEYLRKGKRLDVITSN